ncbi:MAG: ChbG/HpnK family deacetylase [Leptospiraceae bacterium]|nr:ChbG/HpnK family deacetylase [Leptospiraceae bacterium]
MILCADDFGLSPSVSVAIIKLLEAKKISAVSCIVNESKSYSFYRNLNNYQNNVDLGLHLVFTQGSPVSRNLNLSCGFVDKNGYFLDLKLLYLKCKFRSLNYQLVKNEINSQINMFKDLTGMYPDFIDGHQHIHQFSIIKNALLEVVNNIYDKKRIYLRVGYHPESPLGKIKNIRLNTFGSYIISNLGKKLYLELDINRIFKNRFLFGYYNFKKVKHFRSIFDYYLTFDLQHNDIIICHPGFIDDVLLEKETLVDWRLDNFNFLMSDYFEGLINQNKIKLNRYVFNDNFF